MLYPTPPDYVLHLDTKGRARLDIRHSRLNGNLNIYAKFMAAKETSWKVVFSLRPSRSGWLDNKRERYQIMRNAADLVALQLGGVEYRLRSKLRRK